MTTLADVNAADLRAWMSENGWSVRALGPALGVDPRTVQRWRDGSSRVPPMTARALQTLSRAPSLRSETPPESPAVDIPDDWERIPTDE